MRTDNETFRGQSAWAAWLDMRSFVDDGAPGVEMRSERKRGEAVRQFECT